MVRLDHPCGCLAKRNLDLEQTRLVIRYQGPLGPSASALQRVTAFNAVYRAHASYIGTAFSPSGREEPRGEADILPDRQPSCHMRTNRTTRT